MIFKSDLQKQINILKEKMHEDNISARREHRDMQTQLDCLVARFFVLDNAFNDLQTEHSNLVAMTAADFNTIKKIARLKDHFVISAYKPQDEAWIESRRQHLSQNGYIYSHKDAGGNEYFIKPDPETKVKTKPKKKPKKGKK